MTLLSAFAISVIGVPTYDWLMVTGSAARFTSFDYRYWPPTRLRVTSVIVLSLACLVTFSLMHPPEPDDRLWLLLPAIIALCFHGAVAVIDMSRQRNAARLTDES